MHFKRNHPCIAKSQLQVQKMDVNTTLMVQNAIKCFYDQAREEGTLKQYNKIKYQDIIYAIGDYVELYRLPTRIKPVFYIARIRNILYFQKQNQNDESYDQTMKKYLGVPAIQFQWFYRRTDIQIDKKHQKFAQCLSINEIFASNQLFVLPVESIAGKSQVLTLDEYSQLGIVEDSIFFTRSGYDNEKKVFIPDITKWKKSDCHCELPYNPDLEWSECEMCKKWSHNYCLALKKILKDGLCLNCFKTNGKRKRN